MDELTREGFRSVVEALDRQATYLGALNDKQDVQGATLTAVLAQLRELNDNIVRGFTQRDEWGGALTRRVDALEEKVKALESRANGR